MSGFHRPTLVTVAVLVVILFVVYHVALGRKRSS